MFVNADIEKEYRSAHINKFRRHAKIVLWETFGMGVILALWIIYRLIKMSGTYEMTNIKY